jgi:Tat protein translocase TatB subunit
MFDIGFQEMLVIGVLALLVFGPGKLPELGRMIGRALRELRRASDEFRSTVETNLHINDPDPIIPPATAPEPTPAATTPVETAAEGTPLEPAPPVAVEPGEPYCAQRTSRLFHKSDCAWVARIPEADRAYFKHVAEAREQGFATCPVCEPWEPA